MVDIAYLSDGCSTQDMDSALLARWQTYEGIVAFFCHQLGARARAAYHLAAAPPGQLDVVNGGTSRDILQGKGIARLNVGLWACHHSIANLQTQRRDDIAFFAVQVMQQGNTRRTIRIIFDSGHLSGNAQLIALEIDQAIGPLRAAAAMTNGNLALI